MEGDEGWKEMKDGRTSSSFTSTLQSHDPSIGSCSLSIESSPTMGQLLCSFI